MSFPEISILKEAMVKSEWKQLDILLNKKD